MDEEDEAPDPFSSLETAPIADVLRIAPAWLADADTQIPATKRLLNRLRLGSDPETDTRTILRLLCSHVAPQPFIVEEISELLLTSPHPVLLIDFLPQLVSTAQDVNVTVSRYQELVASDRTLLVPIIGSLGDMPLTDAQKNEVFEMTLEALSIVEEADVPAVVRTLLSAMTKDNAKQIVSAIRSATADVKAHKSCTLLLEVVANALRIHVHAVRHLLSAIASSPAVSRLDVFLLVALIGRPRDRKLVVKTLLLAAASGALTLELLSEALQERDILRGYLPSLLSLLRSLLLSHDLSLMDWASQLYRALFVTYPEGAAEALSSLLSVLSSSTNPTQPDAYLAEARTAVSILQDLADGQAAALLPHAHMLEEVLYTAASSLPGELLHPLCRALSLLCRLKEGLKNSLIMFVQKQLFAGSEFTQNAGIVMASHLLRGGSGVDEEALLDWALRMIPAAEYHSSSVLYILDLLSFNAGTLSASCAAAVYRQHLLPLLAKTRLVRGLPELAATALPGPPSAAGRGAPAERAFQVVQCAERQLRHEAPLTAYTHPLYYCQLLSTFLVYQQRVEQSPTPAEVLLGYPIELPPLAERLVSRLSVPSQPADAAEPQPAEEALASAEEVFVRQAFWCCYHAFALSVALLGAYPGDIVDAPNAPFAQKCVDAMQYRAAMLSCLANLTGRWKASEHPLSAHQTRLMACAESSCELASIRLLFRMSAALRCYDDATRVRANADVLNMLHARMTARASAPSTGLRGPKAALKQPAQALGGVGLLTVPAFAAASPAPATTLALPRQLIVELARHRGSFATAGILEHLASVRKLIPGARPTEQARLKFVWKELLKTALRTLRIIFLLLEATRHSRGEFEEAVRALAESDAARSSSWSDLLQHVYDAFASQLRFAENKHVALFLLEILVCITSGLRKARDLAPLFHELLTRSHPSSDPALLEDLLPMSFAVPSSTAFYGRGLVLKLRKGAPKGESDGALVHYALLAEFALLRPPQLAPAYERALGSLVQLFESGLGEHPELSALDSATAPAYYSALLLISAAMVKGANIGLDPSPQQPRSPYRHLRSALKAFGSTCSLFCLAARAKQTTTRMRAELVSALVGTLPAIQRKVGEALLWRATTRDDSADPVLFRLDLVVPLLCAVRSCVSEARAAGAAVKATAARGAGKESAHLPRAIQRTEALAFFLEDTARVHHLRLPAGAGDASEELLDERAAREDSSEASRRAGSSPSRGARASPPSLWSAERRDDAFLQLVGDEDSDHPSVRTPEGAGHDESLLDSDEEEAAGSEDASEMSRFRVVRKRKSSVEEPALDDSGFTTIVVSQPRRK